VARSAETIDLPSASVRLAGVLDLLRIADAADGGRRAAEPGDARVAFVLIGGAAIQSHGGGYDTPDID
jgi:hypothetical protein